MTTFVSLIGGRLAGDLFTFVFFVVVANHFGEVGAGRYSIALGLAGFFFILTDFGLYYYAIQRSDPAAGDGAEVGVALFLRTVLATVLITALLLVLLSGVLSEELAVLIVLLAVSQFGYALRMGLSVVFVRAGQAHLAGLIEASAKLAGAILGILIVWGGGSLVWAVASQPVTSLLAAAVSWHLVRAARCCRPSLDDLRTRALPMLRATVPFGLSEMPRLLAGRTDVLALGLLLGPAAAGAYNAAFRIIFLLQLASHFAGVAIVAEASRAAGGAEAALGEMYRNALKLCVLLGVPSAAGIWLIAPELIELIYGAGFADSVGVLRLLALVLLLSVFRTILASFVTLCGLQARRAGMEWLAAGTMVAASLVLIPWLGLSGAAYAAMLTEALLVALFASQTFKLGVGADVAVRIAAALGGSAGFLAVAAVLPPLPLAVEVLVCVLAYLAILASVPDIRRVEFALALKTARIRPAVPRP